MFVFQKVVILLASLQEEDLCLQRQEVSCLDQPPATALVVDGIATNLGLNRVCSIGVELDKR